MSDWQGKVPLQMKAYVPEREQVCFGRQGDAASRSLSDAEYSPHVLLNEPK